MTMRRMVIGLEPSAPAAFSRRAATEGAHETLDGPTGAALMGWAASRCYDALGERAALVFHSGAVRFSDAVRLVRGKPVFRSPATLLKPKHGAGAICLGRKAYEESSAGENRLAADVVKNRYATLGGKVVARPQRYSRLRTAIDRERRAAEDGKLFGLEAVSARGHCYRAVIECSQDVLDDDGWEILKNCFAGIISLGRARRSGYGGQYRCHLLDDGDNPYPEAKLGEIQADGIARFWLLSDAQLVDPWGQPKAFPDAQDFGLDPQHWELMPGECGVSTRRFAPWNRQYDSRDMELAVIEAGSIVAFKRGTTGEVGDLPPLIGTGHHRGFGRYAVLAPGQKFSEEKGEDAVTSAQHDDATDPQVTDLADDHGLAGTLFRWAVATAQSRAQGDYAEWTRQKIDEAKRLIDRMQGEHPGPAQWGEVAALVTEWEICPGKFGNELDQRLRRDCWNACYVDLGAWVKTDLFADPDGGNMSRPGRARAIERVIKAVRRYQPPQLAGETPVAGEGERQ